MILQKDSEGNGYSPSIDVQKAIAKQAQSVLHAIMRPAGVENKILRVVKEMVAQAYLQGWIERDRTEAWEKWRGELPKKGNK